MLTLFIIKLKIWIYKIKFNCKLILIIFSIDIRYNLISIIFLLLWGISVKRDNDLSIISTKSSLWKNWFSIFNRQEYKKYF
jgi:hypothetical protein